MMYSNYYFKSPHACRTKYGSDLANSQNTVRPKMNVQHSDAQIILEFSLSGVAKEDIKLNVENQIVSLEATRKENDAQKNYTYREFSAVHFKTKVRLPEDVDVNSIQAQFENGVLILKMNKINKPNIQIDIK